MTLFRIVMSVYYCVECTLNVSMKPGNGQFEQNRDIKHIQMDVFVNDIKVKNTQMNTGELSEEKYWMHFIAI